MTEATRISRGRSVPEAPTRRRAWVAAGVIVLLVSACGGGATPSPLPTQTAAATETPQPTETPLAVIRTEVSDLARNEVTFAGIVYRVDEAFVSNEDPRAYAAGGPPEATETFHAFLVMTGNNPTQHRPQLNVGIFSLLLADGSAIEATDLFGTGDDFVAPAAGAADDGFVVFEVESGTSLSGARLRVGDPPDRTAELHLTAPQPAPAFPVELDVSGEVPGIGVTNGSQLLYTLLGGGLFIDNPLEFPNYETDWRANEDELFLVLDIRILMQSGSLEGTFKAQFRLIVDGAPREPWNSPEGGSFGEGAAVDTKVGWLIPASAREVTLQVGDPSEDPGLIPIALPAT